MKKTIKKLTALLLVSLLITVSVPMQSFAGFEDMKIPVIQSVEMAEGSQSVSLKELDEYYSLLFETFEKEEGMVSLDYLKENSPILYEQLMRFQLSSSNFEYIFDVTLANGKTYTFPADEYNVELNRLYELEAEAYITYEDYLAAKEEGADEIRINLYADIYDTLTYNYLPFTEYRGEAVLPLTEMVVKSITPLSPLPEKVYIDADYTDIDGAEFLIEYADGTVKTAEAIREENYETDGFLTEVNYYLDGNDLYVYVDTDYEDFQYENPAELCFSYLDASCTASTVLVDDSMFKSIEITDCDFDAENILLSSLTYKLTYADDREVTFTREFTEQESALLVLGVDINALDGYIVSVDISFGEYDIYDDTINADKYFITAYAGYNSDTYTVDNPHKDIMNGTITVIYFFTDLFDKIRNVFYSIFDLIFFAF